MKGVVRLGIVVAVASGLLGLAACGRPGAEGEVDATEVSNLSWDVQAMESLGIAPDDLPPVAAVAGQAAVADPTPTAKPGRDGDRHRRWKRLRFPFRNTLHGEAVVQTEEGTKTVVVQRGAVTAITSTSVTVRSSDGFTLTWTFSDQLRVFERRNQIQPSAVEVGAPIGVAGEKTGGGTVARLIVIVRPR
jgi:hypothetical protein